MTTVRRTMLLIPAAGNPRLVDAPDLAALQAHVGGWIAVARVGPDWSLYGTPHHGQPIVGDVLLGREDYVGDGRAWIDTGLDDALAFIEQRTAATS